MEIKLTRGMVAIIDDEDAPLVAGRKWHARPAPNFNTFYAASNTGVRGNRPQVLMHRLLLQPPPSKWVDHWDGNGLNNRRSNLRITNRSQNIHNSRRRDNSSGFKGVSYHKRLQAWHAYINCNKRRISIGYFPTAEQAAAAYDVAAKRLYGEFAAPSQMLHFRTTSVGTDWLRHRFMVRA